MNAEFCVLAIVVVTALGFDFTNGFHDTANAMSTSIATGALSPKVAVVLSGLLNLCGAFLSVQVAATVAKGIVDLHETNGNGLLVIVFAGLVGGILWNLLTWLFGIPSSSSHALFGGLIGATVAALGFHGVEWTHGVGQIVTASLVSLAHGTNDAQKTMGVIFLALIAHGTVSASAALPFWVKLTCATGISLGTYLGGWRIIRTLGKGLVDIAAPQGLAAESSSAAIILTSSHFGLPLSTTQTATGSILGTGLGKPGAVVRWGVLARMGAAWLVTLPLAALVGALCWALAHYIGGLPGVLVVFGLLMVLAGYLYLRSRRNPVDQTNVNDEWDNHAAGAFDLETTLR